MTIFTSIDPADIPYRAGQRVKVLRQEPGFTLVMRDLRPAHTVNPILVGFRKMEGADKAEDWVWGIDHGFNDPATPEQINHARRVLTRLANLERGTR